MTERIETLRRFFITEKKHHAERQAGEDPYVLAENFARTGMNDTDRAAERLCRVLQKERPVIFPLERIVFVRTIPAIPELHTMEEYENLKQKYVIHEKGDVCNINVDYTKLLSCGFEEKKKALRKTGEKFGGAPGAVSNEKKHYIDLQIGILDAVQDLAKRYRECAVREGNIAAVESLSRVPAYAPRGFLEALQMMRIIHYVMWCGRNYHNTLGRFDQYMFPYLQHDLQNGVLDGEGALELLEEFFLTCNRDSDLYPGIQQGDNGQSMVLGGRNPDGSDSFNLLSELCLKASLELKLIDPKINLRVHSGTPKAAYLLGTELTKQGLGFPQYSNDDIVIPGLMDLGYEKEDAYNYVVAACWEFIIPGAAMDIPNIAALSFTRAAEEAISNHLTECANIDELYAHVRGNIQEKTAAICDGIGELYIFPAPFLSLMMEDCTEQARDISFGARYNNFGIHGTGIATAADSLAAVDDFVFNRREISAQTMLDALRNDFAGYDVLLNKLRYSPVKAGNDNNTVDRFMILMLDDFAAALKGRVNSRGGIYRAGTGSAMYYIWHGRDTPATPDGRRKGEGIPANYSPSLFARCKGPMSIIRSFTKPDLKKTINGGPLTLELHDSIFRGAEVMEKVASLVKYFIDMGGHQLQLNAVNRDALLDAQKNPENHRNLIVRVWGWSGYFVELDREYQDHIIQRMELTAD
ncbi:MAG: hypothetical protein LBG42_01520 [Treponema sp.]|jgi:formate C-acetyltransferase|nr:hypothetical protein [Treponema sp.]